MDSGAIAGAGTGMGLLFLAGLIFLIVLFVAPIKLYSIHREMRRTNDLLRLQADLLKTQIQTLEAIEDRNRVQLGVLASIANLSEAEKERIFSPTAPASQR